MKKFVSITFSVLEIALIIGAWFVHYFSNKKMGMMRYVVFKNTRWAQKYPLELLKWVTVALIVILTVAVLLSLKKRIVQSGRSGTIQAAGTAVLSLAYVGFTLFFSVRSIRSFYFISGMLALASILQIVKLCLSIKSK